MMKLSDPNYPSDEVLERIADAHWNQKHAASYGVKFFDIYQHNACNHTLSGNIDVDGKEYGFIIESGDRNGTVVHAWGDPEDVGVFEHPKPEEPLTFVPKDRMLAFNNPNMFNVYLSWREEGWFKEKERNYAYDRHFQPGGKIEKYYREWAATKSMEVGLFSDIQMPELTMLSYYCRMKT